MVVLLPYVFQALSILYNLAAQVGFSSTDNNSRCGTAIPMTKHTQQKHSQNVSVRRAIKHSTNLHHLWIAAPAEQSHPLAIKARK